MRGGKVTLLFRITKYTKARYVCYICVVVVVVNVVFDVNVTLVRSARSTTEILPDLSLS